MASSGVDGQEGDKSADCRVAVVAGVVVRSRRRFRFAPGLATVRAPMNTPSHLLLTAALRRAIDPAGIPARAFLAGGVAPDVPLLALSIGGMAYYRLWLGWEATAIEAHLFGGLYFQHPLWICAHNLLHAPLVLLAGLAIASRRAAPRWWWFLAGCALHTAVDIPTHHDDGPLLLFPFDWQTRFQSPISYWDTRHYGGQFTVVEILLDVLLVAYLAVARARDRRAEITSAAAPG
jgi:membrane-bound metal-dependent hydrolase YbcI (DUF457 family)